MVLPWCYRHCGNSYGSLETLLQGHVSNIDLVETDDRVQFCLDILEGLLYVVGGNAVKSKPGVGSPHVLRAHTGCACVRACVLNQTNPTGPPLTRIVRCNRAAILHCDRYLSQKGFIHTQLCSKHVLVKRPKCGSQKGTCTVVVYRTLQ